MADDPFTRAVRAGYNALTDERRSYHREGWTPDVTLDEFEAGLRAALAELPQYEQVGWLNGNYLCPVLPCQGCTESPDAVPVFVRAEHQKGAE